MLSPDRLANDDVAGKELDPLVLGEDPGLAHPVILVDAEPAASERLRHGGLLRPFYEAHRRPSPSEWRYVGGVVAVLVSPGFAS